MTYLQTYLVLGSGAMVAALSRAYIAGTEMAVIDLFGVADGRIAEHWDVMEPVPAAEDLVNSGKSWAPGDVPRLGSWSRPTLAFEKRAVPPEFRRQ